MDASQFALSRSLTDFEIQNLSHKTYCCASKILKEPSMAGTLT